MKKIFIIPDIHGDIKFLHDCLATVESIKEDGDLLVFLGDYVDSWEADDSDMISVLNLMLEERGIETIRLLGNHDVQYIYPGQGFGCSGYRKQLLPALHEIFKENLTKFDILYESDGILFSHAGISGWWNNKLDKPDMSPREASHLFHMDPAWRRKFMEVGATRGGDNKTGGPIWCDKSELKAHMLPDSIQVVGHSVVSFPAWHYSASQNSKVLFTDCSQKYMALLEVEDGKLMGHQYFEI